MRVENMDIDGFRAPKGETAAHFTTQRRNDTAQIC